MKLGKQIKYMKENKEKWKKFIDKCNKRNEEIRKRKELSHINL
jgi:hypothetical protein